MKISNYLAIVLLGLAAFSCQDIDSSLDSTSQEIVSEEIIFKGKEYPSFPLANSNPNARLTDLGYDVKIYSAEYITAPESNQVGRTVIFSNTGSKVLAFDFSPLAKLYDVSEISYYVDEYRPASTVDVASSAAAIDRAAQTWDGVACSDLGMYKIGAEPIPLGYVASAFGFASLPALAADINHYGWMPAEFFDLVDVDGSQFILGVTFTLLWTNENGDYIDTNGDGKFDVAGREIYYNDNFYWGDNDEDVANGNAVDVESIALHEMGHGLSQAHFGKAFVKKNGNLQFAPSNHECRLFWRFAN